MAVENETVESETKQSGHECGIRRHLVRLPNGDWVHPCYVLMVEACEGLDEEDDDEIEGFVPPRVIYHIHGDRRMIECATIEKACHIRDEIAAAVNGGAS